MELLFQQFLKASEKTPEKTAIWCDGETRTYARSGMRIRRDPKEKLERQLQKVAATLHRSHLFQTIYAT